MFQPIRRVITATLVTAALLAPTAAQAQTVIYRSVSPRTESDYREYYYPRVSPRIESDYYREYHYPRVYRSTPRTVIRGDVEDSTLVRPVIIDSTIEDSTIVNPVIVSPRRSSRTIIRERSSTGYPSTGQQNPACMAFSDIRIACQQ